MCHISQTYFTDFFFFFGPIRNRLRDVGLVGIRNSYGGGYENQHNAALFFLILPVKGVFITTNLLLLFSHPLEMGVALAATGVGCDGQTAVTVFLYLQPLIFLGGAVRF